MLFIFKFNLSSQIRDQGFHIFDYFNLFPDKTNCYPDIANFTKIEIVGK